MEKKFQYDVFLSHSSSDKPKVRLLAERLRDVGLRVWFDEWEVKFGGNIYLAIQNGLQTSRVQLLCMSPSAFGSDWVGLEGSTAIFRDPANRQRRFLPVLIVDCDIPDTIACYKYVDYKAAKESAFQDILDALDPETGAAYKEGTDKLKRYLAAKSSDSSVLNEAKLLLIGERGVGKSWLLGALSGNGLNDNERQTEEIVIQEFQADDTEGQKSVKLNAWDFGGQQVYRAVHQLFFSDSAIYLVVWAPRAGSQQGFVKEWIDLIKRRASGARILVVATHGGPKERQPDINRQEIWDEFGKETVVDFFHVDSKPNTDDNGLVGLKAAIVRAVMSLPQTGRSVATSWETTRLALWATQRPYMRREEVLEICEGSGMGVKDAHSFLEIEHRLGRLACYDHEAIRDFVILRPSWLACAISRVFDENRIKQEAGYANFSLLCDLWDDLGQTDAQCHSLGVHRLILRLMEQFDLCCWLGKAKGETWPNGLILIGDLVPSGRPDTILEWPDDPDAAKGQQTQICKIVDIRTGQPASADGIISRLIVRLQRFWVGHFDRNTRTQWQRGLFLMDEYGAKALVELIGYDVRISVRSATVPGFLSIIADEVKSLVDGWGTLRCEVMIPCPFRHENGDDCIGMFDIGKLVLSKNEGRNDYPCPVCKAWHSIESLLHSAPGARPNQMKELLTNPEKVMAALKEIRKQLAAQQDVVIGRFDKLDASGREIMSTMEDGYTALMRTMLHEAKDGPRLFSFEPVKPGFWDRPKWMSTQFRLTLWCEHSRMPLWYLNGKDDKSGVYEITIPKDWLVKAAPFLKLLTGVLALVAPVASAATKLAMDDAGFKAIENQLGLGEKCFDALLKGGEQAGGWLSKGDGLDVERGEGIEARGAVLRQLHAWLKEKDPGFGGLVRVMNQRQEFLWVHPQFEKEY